LYGKSIDETLEQYESPSEKKAKKKGQQNKGGVNRALDFEEDEDEEEIDSENKPLPYKYLTLLKN